MSRRLGQLYLVSSKKQRARREVIKDYPLPKGAVYPRCMLALENVWNPGGKEIEGLTEIEAGWVLDTAEALKAKTTGLK